jgi:hypothetical protein
MRRFASYLSIALLCCALSAGCKSACRQLSEKLCDCLDTTVAKDSCKRVAANEESRVGVTLEQEDYCEAQLPLCSCADGGAETAEGKQACGVAR